MEKYNPDESVCDNQDDFNTAFQNALKYGVQKKENKDKPYSYVYFVLLVIFIVWAVMIALKSNSRDKIVQLVFAIVFSPFYVISHYLSLLVMSSNKNIVNMGMCSCAKN